MAKELKIRISNVQVVEDKIKQIGGYFVEERPFTDTYFKQPKGFVLKISLSQGKYFLGALQKKDGMFEILRNEPIQDPEKTKNELMTQYGIKRVLQGKRRKFQLTAYTVTICQIEYVGDFLILTGENPTQDFLSTTFGIPNPEYVTDSFDDLPVLMG